MLGHTEDIGYPDTEDGQMETLRNFINTDLDWEKGLRVWQLYTGFDREMRPEKGEKDTESEPEEDKRLAFLCTCYRTGSGHKFKSTELHQCI